jgi:hypothetical protein
MSDSIIPVTKRIRSLFLFCSFVPFHPIHIRFKSKSVVYYLSNQILLYYTLPSVGPNMVFTLFIEKLPKVGVFNYYLRCLSCVLQKSNGNSINKRYLNLITGGYD